METRKGMLLVAGAGIFWATTGIFSTMLFRQNMDPVGVASTRTFLAIILFFMFLILPQLKILRATGKQLLKLALVGLVAITIFSVFYMNSINLIGVSTAVVLLYTSPVFAVILSRLLLREPLTPEKLISLALTFSGVVLVSEAFHLSSLQENTAGILTGLGSGLAFATLSVAGKHLLGEIPRLTANFYILFFGGVFLAFIYPPWELFKEEFNFSLWMILAGLVVISTFLSHYCYVTGLSYIEASRASITVAVEPVAAIFMAFIFLGEQLVTVQYLGVILVLSGVLILRLGGRQIKA